MRRRAARRFLIGVETPEFRRRAEAQGAKAIAMTPAELAALDAKERATWDRIVKLAQGGWTAGAGGGPVHRDAPAGAQAGCGALLIMAAP